jgi:hypothetical protein
MSDGLVVSILKVGNSNTVISVLQMRGFYFILFNS